MASLKVRRRYRQSELVALSDFLFQLSRDHKLTLNSLVYGPRQSCLSPWYADFEKYQPFGRFSTVHMSRA
jgi:hypothetical protein